MVKIHGGLWVGMAILMYAYTLFIEARAEHVTLPVFKYIAVLFLVWGAFRMTSDFILKREKKEKVGPPKKSQEGHQPIYSGSPHASHQHTRGSHPRGAKNGHARHPTQYASHPASQHMTKTCPHCRHAVPHAQQTCPYCGFRFY